MNFYKRHIGDYLKATSHLSLLEHGIYTRLLDVYYTREGAIPSDQAARLVGARSKDEREALDAVLGEFFVLVEGAWTQKRCDAEIAHYQEKAERNREVGKKGGRSATQKEPTNNPDGFQKETQSEPTDNPSHKPVTSNQKNLIAPVAQPKGSRLPKDWALPAEWETWCRAERPDLDPRVTAEIFRDFWVAKAGKDASKLDWEATWRNWVRNSKPGTFKPALAAVNSNFAGAR